MLKCDGKYPNRKLFPFKSGDWFFAPDSFLLGTRIFKARGSSAQSPTTEDIRCSELDSQLTSEIHLLRM